MTRRLLCSRDTKIPKTAIISKLVVLAASYLELHRSLVFSVFRFVWSVILVITDKDIIRLNMSKGVLQFLATPIGPGFSVTIFLVPRRTLARKEISFHSTFDFASTIHSSESSSASISLLSSESDYSCSHARTWESWKFFSINSSLK